MAIDPVSPSRRGLGRRLIRWWFALTKRKIRTLQAGDIMATIPAVFVVTHPPGFFQAVALSTAIDRPARCLLPNSFVRGPFAAYFARQLGMILYDGEEVVSVTAQQEATGTLRSGGAVIVFADVDEAGQSPPGTLARTAALVVGRAEAPPGGRRVGVYPVHLYLPESAAQSREILVYIDSVTAPRKDWRAGSASGLDTPDFIRAVESRFQENTFQLRPADLNYFLTDLEKILQCGLQEDWASRPEWIQGTDGFVLSRWVTDWANQTNYTKPARLVAWRQSLDDYSRLQKQCALWELEVEGGGASLRSGGQRALLWFETIVGLPIALYGLLNHLMIFLVLFLAGSFNRKSSRTPSAEMKIRVGVTLGFYALQIFLVAHWRGRAAAGYYAPTLPVSGWYLWRRYAELVRPQARLLFISLTIPGLKRKIQRMRQRLLTQLDQTLSSYEGKVSAPR